MEGSELIATAMKAVAAVEALTGRLPLHSQSRLIANVAAGS